MKIAVTSERMCVMAGININISNWRQPAMAISCVASMTAMAINGNDDCEISMKVMIIEINDEKMKAS